MADVRQAQREIIRYQRGFAEGHMQGFAEGRTEERAAILARLDAPGTREAVAKGMWDSTSWCTWEVAPKYASQEQIDLCRKHAEAALSTIRRLLSSDTRTPEGGECG